MGGGGGVVGGQLGNWIKNSLKCLLLLFIFGRLKNLSNLN